MALARSKSSFCSSESLSPERAFLETRSMARSTVSRSASASSSSITSMSLRGSTGSSRTTFEPPKQRTTCMIASVSRMFERNLFPSPSPFDAPAIRPAMSTIFTDAGMTLSVWMNRWMVSRLASGTAATATLGSMVQKGKFPSCAPAAVRALNRVLLPTLGKPTIPQETLMRAERIASRRPPGSAQLPGPARARQSISTRTSLGRRAASMVTRAGGSAQSKARP